MKRRNLMLIVAGGAAALAGWSWQQRRDPVLAHEASDLWQARFARPEGGELNMASLRGRPLVLNFWGTWCPPCVKEMPELDSFHHQWSASGGQVVGLAVDSPGAVREFLVKRPVGYTIGLAGFEGSELSRKLGNTQGSLPFTVVFNRRGEMVHRKLGAINLAELAEWTSGL